MTESIKLYAKDANNHVWCKTLERGDVSAMKYKPVYSEHKDNTIFTYDIANTRDLDGLYLVRAKTSSLSGVSEGDVFPVIKFWYFDEYDNEYDDVYYACDFGLNKWHGSAQQWGSNFEVIDRVFLSSLFVKTGAYSIGDTGARINLIFDTFFNESWSIQLIADWTYYAEDTDISRPTAVTLVYGIPATGANLTYDASSIITVHCVNGLNKLYEISLDKVLRNINSIESLDEDLSITVDGLNNVTEQVDEMAPIVDSLEDRVSALESETISKYVSR